MQNIGTIATGRTIRAAEIWLAMIVFTVALLFAVTAAGAGARGPSAFQGPPAGHTACYAEAVTGPCS